MKQTKQKTVVTGLAVQVVRSHALEMLALADQADEAGSAVVEPASLAGVLRQFDDVARADLVAAITEAAAGAN